MGAMAVHPARHRLASLVLTAGLALSGAGCTGPPRETTPPGDEPVPLEVEVVSGAEDLSQDQVAAVQDEVGDVLSQYVVDGFLGDYPRTDFVASFESFTGAAARKAVQSIDVLTANTFRDAEEVRAQLLTVRISCLVHRGELIGATAHVRFDFVADLGEQPEPFSLRGQFFVERQGRSWTIFGYDVARTTEERPT